MKRTARAVGSRSVRQAFLLVRVRAFAAPLARARCLALLLLPAAACNLVGYDELRESAGASDAGLVASIVPEPPDAGFSAHQGALDAARLPALDASPASDAARDQGRDALGAEDGAIDTGPSSPDDGWWDGVPPDQVCSAGEACYPQCMAPGDRCVFECASASDCEVTCSPESACHADCGSAAYCELACKEDSQCWLACQDSSQCKAWCTTGSDCRVDCTGADSCSLTCLDGSSCEVDCRGDVDCSDYTCSDAASCLEYCGSAGCHLSCSDGGASCDGDIQVCHRPCP